jgi:hypothetical protein
VPAESGEKLEILGTLEVELDRNSADKAVDDLKRKMQGASSVQVQAVGGPGSPGYVTGHVPRGSTARTPGDPTKAPPTRLDDPRAFARQFVSQTNADVARGLAAGLNPRNAAAFANTGGAAGVAARAAAGAGAGRVAAGLAVAGVGAAAVAGVVAAALALPGLAVGAWKISEQLAQRQIARGAAFSPAIRTVQILEDLRVRQREIARGAILAPSLNLQRQATQDVYDALARITTPIEGWINDLGASINQGIASTLNGILDRLGIPAAQQASMLGANSQFIDYFYAVRQRGGQSPNPVQRPALPAPYIAPSRRARP